MEEEIDLREYIVILLKYWKWIVGVAIIVAIIAFIITSFLSPIYQAQASVIILKSSTEISLAPQFQTKDGVINQRTLQQTFVQMAKTGNLARLILDQAIKENLLDAETTTINQLLSKVTVKNEGDIISIVVHDQSPQLAAQLANLWVVNYETYLNQLFDHSNAFLLEQVQNQFKYVNQRYTTAQTDWEDFLNNNQILALEREIEIKQRQANELQIFTLSNVNLDNTNQRLTYRYEKLTQLESWLDDIVSMKQQLTNLPANSSFDVALSYILLQREVLATATDENITLQINITDLLDQNVSIADVEALITTIQERKTRLEQEIVEISTTLSRFEVEPNLDSESDPIAQLIENIDAEIHTLQVELEKQKALEDKLKRLRDAAQEDLKTVQRKLDEVQLDSYIIDSQVRIITQAIEPTNPVSPKRFLIAAISAMIGLAITIFVVFIKEYWQNTDKKVK